VAGCGGNKQSADDIIVVDVTKSYPEKELILQDFMDVEYIALDSSDDEFLCQGVVVAVGKEIMLIRNQISDGNIFVFDRNGKGLRKINRRGQGPEEYASITGITLDEDSGEIFVKALKQGIIVYDLYGNFLRNIPVREDFLYSSELQNYDREHLICGEYLLQVDEKSKETQSGIIISKKDGSIVNDIRVHIEKGVNTRVNDGMMVVFLSSMVKSFIPYHDRWILTELSSDTIFSLSPDYKMIPFITRTPSIHSMSPEVFLLPVLLTDRYYFMETLKREIEYITRIIPRIELLYDRQEKTIYRYTVYNNDYAIPKPLEFMLRYSNMSNEIAYMQKLEAYELIELNEKGELKGKLKEVAAKLDEDSNPVIMLVKHKR
jgi:hypothetical protein